MPSLKKPVSAMKQSVKSDETISAEKLDLSKTMSKVNGLLDTMKESLEFSPPPFPDSLPPFPDSLDSIIAAEKERLLEEKDFNGAQCCSADENEACQLIKCALVELDTQQKEANNLTEVIKNILSLFHEDPALFEMIDKYSEENNSNTLAEAHDNPTYSIELLEIVNNMHQHSEEGLLDLKPELANHLKSIVQGLFVRACIENREEFVDELFQLPVCYIDGFDSDKLMAPLFGVAYANNARLVNKFLDSGATINLLNKKKQNPLHVAARQGCIDAVKVLVERGANVDAFDIDNITPVMESIRAVKRHGREVFDFLINKAKMYRYERKSFFCSIFIEAAFSDDFQIFQDVLKMYEEKSFEISHDEIYICLMEICLRNSECPEILKYIIKEFDGIKLLIQKDDSMIILHKAFEFDYVENARIILDFMQENINDYSNMLHSIFCEALLTRNYKMVEYFVSATPSICSPTDLQNSLAMACKIGNQNLVKLLLDMKVQPTVVDFVAVFGSCSQEFTQIVNMLIHNESLRSKLTIKNLQSALLHAAEKGFTKAVKDLTQKNVIIHCLDEKGYTPLMKACENGHYDIVTFLVAHGANINYITKTNPPVSAIILACKNKHKEIVNYLLNQECVLNHASRGITEVLFEATRNGSSEIVAMLIKWASKISKIKYTQVKQQASPKNKQNALTNEKNLNSLESPATNPPSNQDKTSSNIEMAPKESNKNSQPSENLSCQIAAEENSVANTQDEPNESDKKIQPSKNSPVDSLKVIQDLKQSINSESIKFSAESRAQLSDLISAKKELSSLKKYKDNSEKNAKSLASIKEKCLKYIKSDPELLKKVKEWTIFDKESKLVKQRLNSVKKPYASNSFSKKSPVAPIQPNLDDASKYELNFDSDALQDMCYASENDDEIANNYLNDEEQSDECFQSKIIENESEIIENLKESSVDSLSESKNSDTEKAQQLAEKLRSKMMQVKEIKLRKNHNSGGCHGGTNKDGSPMFCPDCCKTHAKIKNQLSASSYTLDSDCQKELLTTIYQDSKFKKPVKTQNANPKNSSDQNVPKFCLDTVTSKSFDTPLSIACSKGYTEIVQLLLRAGVNVEHQNRRGITPLMLAVEKNHHQIVKLLIENGVNVNFETDRSRDSALGISCASGSFKSASLLIQAHADIEHQNANDYTPLCFASSGGHFNIVKLLIKAAALPDGPLETSKSGITPLMLATMQNHKEIVRFLLKHNARINAQIETNKNTALTFACIQDHHEIAQILVEEGDANIEHRSKPGFTPLMEAAANGNFNCAKYLIECGADINPMPSIVNKDNLLTLACMQDNLQLVKRLVSAGASIEHRNKKGANCLFVAARSGHLNIVKYLINYTKIDPNESDVRNVSPIFVAFKYGHVAIVRYLARIVSNFPSDQDMTMCIQLAKSPDAALDEISTAELVEDMENAMAIIIEAKALHSKKASSNIQNLLKSFGGNQQEVEKPQATKKTRTKKKSSTPKNKKRIQSNQKGKKTKVVSLLVPNNASDSKSDHTPSKTTQKSPASTQKSSNDPESLQSSQKNDTVSPRTADETEDTKVFNCDESGETSKLTMDGYEESYNATDCSENDAEQSNLFISTLPDADLVSEGLMSNVSHVLDSVSHSVYSLNNGAYGLSSSNQVSGNDEFNISTPSNTSSKNITQSKPSMPNAPVKKSQPGNSYANNTFVNNSAKKKHPNGQQPSTPNNSAIKSQNVKNNSISPLSQTPGDSNKLHQNSKTQKSENPLQYSQPRRNSSPAVDNIQTSPAIKSSPNTIQKIQANISTPFKNALSKASNSQKRSDTVQNVSKTAPVKPVLPKTATNSENVRSSMISSLVNVSESISTSGPQTTAPKTSKSSRYVQTDGTGSGRSHKSIDRPHSNDIGHSFNKSVEPSCEYELSSEKETLQPKTSSNQTKYYTNNDYVMKQKSLGAELFGYRQNFWSQQRDSESSSPFSLNLESSGLKAPNPKHFANALVDNTQVASKMLQEMDCFKFIDELVALNVDEKTKGNDQTVENINSYCKSNDFESFKPPILSNSEKTLNSMNGHNIPANFHQNLNNVQSLNPELQNLFNSAANNSNHYQKHNNQSPHNFHNMQNLSQNHPNSQFCANSRCHHARNSPHSQQNYPSSFNSVTGVDNTNNQHNVPNKIISALDPTLNSNSSFSSNIAEHIVGKTLNTTANNWTNTEPSYGSTNRCSCQNHRCEEDENSWQMMRFDGFIRLHQAKGTYSNKNQQQRQHWNTNNNQSSNISSMSNNKYSNSAAFPSLNQKYEPLNTHNSIAVNEDNNDNQITSHQPSLAQNQQTSHNYQQNQQIPNNYNWFERTNTGGPIASHVDLYPSQSSLRQNNFPPRHVNQITQESDDNFTVDYMNSSPTFRAENYFDTTKNSAASQEIYNLTNNNNIWRLD